MKFEDFVRECNVTIKKLTAVSEYSFTVLADPTTHSMFHAKFIRSNLIFDDIQEQRKLLKLSQLSPENLDQLNSLLEKIDDLYDSIQAVNIQLTNMESGVIANQKSNAENSNNVHLPLIQIPKFSGNPIEWTSFYDLFSSLIHSNTKLSNIEKFQYLISALSDEPLKLVKHLPLTSDNYNIAFTTLEKRYDNKRILISTYWGNIFNSPKAETDSATSLRTLLSIFSENIFALKKYAIDLWDFTLFNWLMQKIDSNTRKRFEMYHSNTEIPTYENLNKFLSDQCTALESSMITSNLYSSNSQQLNPNTKKSSHSSFSHKQYTQSSTKSNQQSLVAETSSKSNVASAKPCQTCFVCKAQHSIFKCDLFLNKSPQDRYDFIKECKRCVNCFGTHSLSTCASQSTCRVCQRRHHTMLHFPREATSNSTSNSINNTAISDIPQVVASALAPVTVLLSTALVSICDTRGNFQTCRALIDNGSQISIISEKCLNRLNLPVTQCSIPIQGIGRTSSPTCTGLTACQVTPLFRRHPNFIIQAMVMPVICNDVPSSHIATHNYKHLINLPLADPDYRKPSEIDILLGADVYSQIIQPGIKYGRPGEPIAMKTIFGWILSGKINHSTLTTVNSFHVSIESELDSTLKKFWELESVPNKILNSPEDIKCEQNFIDSHTRDDSGRYTVSLPFREEIPILGDSFNSAMRRFLSLENRLNKNSALKQEYSNFMQDYFDSGHMSHVGGQTHTDYQNHTDSCYYIPHHCVLKPESSTTKLRVVFDASAKTSNNISLNDTLLTGSKLQQDIVSLLLRFRIHSIVLIADIKQMYRQVLVKPDHRAYQRILWRFSPDSPVQEFELNTVTYGVSSAPFLAIRTLLQLASDEKHNFPYAAKVIFSDIYVDDVVTGCSSLEEAITLQSQLQGLLKSGGFDLRKWSSNNPIVLDSIPPSLRQTNCQSFDTVDSFQKVLGMNWNPSSDSFSYKIETIERCCTKRSILSEVARIFDPLGLLAPLTLFAKHLIQVLWTQGLSWDEAPSADICSRWSQYKRELPCLAQLELPRRIIMDKYQSCELHGFCDASLTGYACVVYFRVTLNDGSVRIFFVCAKSKVSPLKRITIPRLELCAALLLSDLVHFVCQTYVNIVFNKIYAWSDSTVALTWIKSSPHQWKTFIANRVTQIQEKISPQNWYHINGTDNPADCASRGLLPCDLLNCSAWWAGPKWLSSLPELWPICTSPTPSCEIDLEVNTISLIVTKQNDFIMDLLMRFSSLRKVQGSIAYLIRFIQYLKNKSNLVQGPLVDLELHNSLLIIIRHVQCLVFANEIKQIRSNNPCSKPIRKLAPFLDPDGTLRVGGRLRYSQESFQRKHPILLPRDHRLTKLLIIHYHHKYLHPGATALQALLAEQFWILSARRAVNHCISHCYRCSRHNPKSYTPLMSDLPTYRVSEVKPFLHTGVDFAGPFALTFGRRRGGKTQKAYLCLFVCLATKALHLELASDLSSDAFIAALRRFVARRGQCSDLYSDNGTNFVGANRQLNEVTQSAAGIMQIRWHFNPPSSPHFGGLWEAGVKSVKHHISRVVGDQVLTYEELNTIFHQIEAILNSRPLCQLSSDPNDLQALTPGHFLTLSSLTAPPDEELTSVPLNRLSRWQLLQQIQQSFWKRWHNEYLHTLQQRSKWTDRTKPPSIGTIVIIKQDNVPPLTWHLGRIAELHPSPDGQIRTATVQTANGRFKRPLVKLCPVPTHH